MTTPITLAEALAVVLYVRSRDDFFYDEQEVAAKAWKIVQNEAQRVISKAMADRGQPVQPQLKNPYETET